MITVHNNSTPTQVAKSLASNIIAPTNAEKNFEAQTKNYKAFDYKNTITWEDPTSTADEANTIGATYLADSRFNSNNRAKTADLAIVSGNSGMTRYVEQSGQTYVLSKSPFGNWREYSTNGFTTISNRVKINLEQPFHAAAGFEFSVGQGDSAIQDSSMYKLVKQGSDLLDSVDALVNGGANSASPAPKGLLMSRYSQMPILESFKFTPSNLSSVTFSFRFGQAQLYSAEEEVVKPILALASIFSPHQGASAHRYVAHIPVKKDVQNAMMTNFLASAQGSLIDTVVNTIKNALDGEGNPITDIIEGMRQVEEDLYTAYDAAVGTVLSNTLAFCMCIGPTVVGPLIPTSVSWDFDFTDVDEYGYPTFGQITFGGNQFPFTMSAGEYRQTWGYTSVLKSDAEVDPLQETGTGDQWVSEQSSNEENTGDS